MHPLAPPTAGRLPPPLEGPSDCGDKSPQRAFRQREPSFPERRRPAFSHAEGSLCTSVLAPPDVLTHSTVHVRVGGGSSDKRSPKPRARRPMTSAAAWCPQGGSGACTSAEVAHPLRIDVPDLARRASARSSNECLTTTRSYDVRKSPTGRAAAPSPGSMVGAVKVTAEFRSRHPHVPEHATQYHRSQDGPPRQHPCRRRVADHAAWSLISDHPDKRTWPSLPWPEGASVIVEVRG